MIQFCKDCGSPIKEGARFCSVCGKPVSVTAPEKPKTPACVYCGKELKPTSKFCPVCGKPVGAAAPEKPKTPACVYCGKELKPTSKFCPVCGKPVGMAVQTTVRQAVVSQAASQTSVRIPSLANALAASQPGEAVLTTFGGVANDISGAAAQVTQIMNPFKTLLAGIQSLGRGFIGLFSGKNIKGLIFAIVIAVLWILLMLLQYLGINILPVNVLSWFTFAQGGMDRGIIGSIGGLLGKSTVAAAIFSLFNGGFKSLGNGFRSLFSGSNFKAGNIGCLLLGFGAALCLYQFFAGRTSLGDTMAALSGALLSVQSLGRGSGFIYQMIQSLTAKKAGGTRIGNGDKVRSMLSGGTFGFIFGTQISVIPFGWLALIIGSICLMVGLILSLVLGDKRGVAAV